MKEQQKSKGISSAVIAAVSAAVVTVGGGVAWLTSNTNPTPEPPGREQLKNQKVSVYWLENAGTNLKLESQPIQVKSDGEPNKVLQTAFKQLLAGPTEGTGSTTIPQGTQLLGIKVESDAVRINLSEEFTSGGGSTSMTGRLGQVIYTATSLNSKAKVYIEVNGKPLEVLGGEGLVLNQPLTRESFNQNFEL
ncbi:GerMN domain-containing protein [Mastigocoleus testarum]|uniref:Spore germination protein n=1 Tax=Mastigocoleus testarum BC008 TaxID=371196 RepID=A0A0V7ZZ25_9CYAN|nr:GerMN domain-containing protein [Mastigocoleus testarum]KST67645.1 spore germination protein [Mastigocoleus testarum BC008]KST69853.1 spore germination protein [Mastigocoleus testarum BC008]